MTIPICRSLTVLLGLVLLLLVPVGCGSTPPPAATRIDPASVSLSQKYHDQDSGSYEVRVSPSKATTTAPATQPVRVVIDGKEVTAPGNSEVVITSNVPASTDVTSEAQAAGPTLRTNGDKGNFDSSAPSVELPGGQVKGLNNRGTKGGGGTANGGDTSLTWQNIVNAVSAASSGQKALWIIGILMLVASVVMIIVEHVLGGLTDWFLVAILAGGGFLFIGIGIIAEKSPWVLALIPVAVVGGIIWYVVKWLKKTPTPVPAKPIVTIPNGTSGANTVTSP